MPEKIAPAPPLAVAWLGYGGLAPFVLLAAAAHLDSSPTGPWAGLLLAYGAVILSFVGALHWGVAMVVPQTGHGQGSAWFGWSVVPSLLGWLALGLLQFGMAGAAGWTLLAGFVAHYRMDLRLVRQAPLPGWYLPLRLRLTVVACLCIAAVAGAGGST